MTSPYDRIGSKINVVRTYSATYEERHLVDPVCTRDRYSEVNELFPEARSYCASEELQLKQEMSSIYGHPLFPLLTLIFDKCELATNAPRPKHSTKPATGARSSRAAPTTHRDRFYSSESLNDDIHVFAEQIALTGGATFRSNPDVDDLMIQAIAVLRFHVLEMEKVHELCDSFCSRYISCLEGKMPSELITDEESSAMTPIDLTPNYHQFVNCSPEDACTSDESGAESENGSNADVSRVPDDCHGHDASMCVPFDRDPIYNTSNNNNDVYEHGSDAGDCSLEESVGFGDKKTGDLISEYKGSTRKQKKRGTFPKMATNILRTWLFQRTSYPYPSEEQKRDLSDQTGLTISQVNNWFINARRRIIQPMIDQTNRTVCDMRTTASSRINRGMDKPAGVDCSSPAGSGARLPPSPPQPQQPTIYANTINRSASESADNIIRQRRAVPLEEYHPSPGCGQGMCYPSWLDGNQSSAMPCFESDYFRSPAINGSGFVDTIG